MVDVPDMSPPVRTMHCMARHSPSCDWERRPCILDGRAPHGQPTTMPTSLQSPGVLEYLGNPTGTRTVRDDGSMAVYPQDLRSTLIRQRSHVGSPPKCSTRMSMRARTLPATCEPGGRTMLIPYSEKENPAAGAPGSPPRYRRRRGRRVRSQCRGPPRPTGSMRRRCRSGDDPAVGWRSIDDRRATSNRTLRLPCRSGRRASSDRTACSAVHGARDNRDLRRELLEPGRCASRRGSNPAAYQCG